MVDWCYLCEKKASPADNISLHRFPKNEKLRALWLKACGLTPNDDVRQSFLCSRHFRPDHIARRESVVLRKIKSYLKRTAVPTLLLPGDPLLLNQSDDNNSSSLNDNLEKTNENGLATAVKTEEIDIVEHKVFDSTNGLETNTKNSSQEPKKVTSDDAMLVTPKLEVPAIHSADNNNSSLDYNLEKVNESGLAKVIKTEEIDIAEHKVFNSNSDKINTEDSSQVCKKIKLMEPCSPNETLKTDTPSMKSEYRVTNGRPGFTDETFRIIESRCSEEIGIVNLLMNEMLMSEGITYGDDGVGNVPKATRALTFMVVSMKEGWKIPIGYFLIHTLNSKDCANILAIALQLLNKANCKVVSVTCDGSMLYTETFNVLGANLNYGPDFMPYFINPITSEPCYIFYDVNRMITLVRNALRANETIKTTDGKYILWSYIRALFAVQCERKQQYELSSKLTKEHFQYSENMNAELAVQTLSENVYQDLLFLQTNGDKMIRRELAECSATACFCLNFHNIGEMLNCKSKFSKGEFNTPLTEENYEKMKENALKLETYITTFQTENNKRLIYTNMKTGFIGLIIDLRNIFPLFDKLKSLGMNYLLTGKLSQVYIETLFRALKSHGGFERPNASQFQNAYKLMLQGKKERRKIAMKKGVKVLIVQCNPGTTVDQETR